LGLASRLGGGGELSDSGRKDGGGDVALIRGTQLFAEKELRRDWAYRDGYAVTTKKDMGIG